MKEVPESVKTFGRLFLIVTVFAALVTPTFVAGNFSADGVNVTGKIPFPVRLTDCGLLLALSVTLSVADLAPTAPGAKAMLIVQVAFTASVAPQV